MYRVTFHHCWCLHLRVMLFVMNELCRIEQWLSKGRSFALSTKAAVSSTSQRVQLMDRLVILGGSQQECIEACWSGSCCWKQVHCLSSVSLYLVNTKVKVCSLTEERVFFLSVHKKKGSCMIGKFPLSLVISRTPTHVLFILFPENVFAAVVKRRSFDSDFLWRRDEYQHSYSALCLKAS